MAYNYIYKDDEEKYSQVHIDTISYNENYDYHNISIEVGKIYYDIEISQCDVTTEVHTGDTGKSCMEVDVSTSDYEPFAYYMLHYDDFLFGIGKGDLVVEELIYEDE